MKNFFLFITKLYLFLLTTIINFVRKNVIVTIILLIIFGLFAKFDSSREGIINSSKDNAIELASNDRMILSVAGVALNVAFVSAKIYPQIKCILDNSKAKALEKSTIIPCVNENSKECQRALIRNIKYLNGQKDKFITSVKIYGGTVVGCIDSSVRLFNQTIDHARNSYGVKNLLQKAAVGNEVYSVWSQIANHRNVHGY